MNRSVFYELKSYLQSNSISFQYNQQNLLMSQKHYHAKYLPEQKDLFYDHFNNSSVPSSLPIFIFSVVVKYLYFPGLFIFIPATIKFYWVKKKINSIIIKILMLRASSYRNRLFTTKFSFYFHNGIGRNPFLNRNV